jgi:hypothetical protein
MSNARVTVTLPPEVVREIDREESNRSRFVLDAVRRELLRRRREQLKKSLRKPHPDSLGMVDQGFSEWADGLPDENTSDLIAPGTGKAVRWTANRGWIEGKE